jgi:hypothetical protein
MAKAEIYPRATPYRPTEVNGRAPHQPSMRNQILLISGFCTLFLGLGLGIGLFVLNRPSRAEQSAPEKEKEPAEKPQRGQGELDDTLPVKPRDTGAGTGPLQLPTPEKETKKAEGAGLSDLGGKMTSQPGNPVAIPEAVVEALGGLMASHLYQTYLNIGLLADSVEGEVYDKEEARKLLDTVAGLMTAVEQQLDRVGRQSLKAEERKAVEQARLVTASLRNQTRELMEYWDKGEKDHVARFHQARQDSWIGIKNLLNIQE